MPTAEENLGKLAFAARPVFEQLFVSRPAVGDAPALSGIALDRRTFRLRKRARTELDAYFVSLSARTLGYKGMVTTLQLEPFYPDLQDERFASELAVVHSRYSTNTFPSWPLAQPLRMLAHNGEINTVNGNRNWMRARQSQLESELLGDLAPVLPICTPGASDSASFDEVLELLTLTGRSLPHAIMMMVPEAYEKQVDIDPKLRSFYEFHSMQMEPWDGPAALIFTDGTLVGATLDRNGLRPGRWTETTDGLIVIGSETGVLDFAPERIKRRGRLRPGRMFLVDTEQRRVIEDDEIKAQLADLEPWQEWLDAGRVRLADLPEREHIVHPIASITRRQRTFGYTEEEVRILLTPMGQTGAEPLGAMGSDTPVAVLSERPRLLFDYFTQQFAQVTNPPLDSIREEVVTSLALGLGPERNLLSWGPDHTRVVTLDFPVIDNDELAKIQHIDTALPGRTSVTIRGLYRVEAGHKGMQKRLAQMCDEVDQAIEDGAEFIVLSDRDSNKDLAPIPSLLMLAAVHHHLIRNETRMKCGLVVEAGDVREVHHVATLIGYGASAVNPVPRDGDGRVPRPRRLHHRHPAREGRQEPDLRARQGRAQDHVEDGHLDGLVLRRRPGVRGRSACRRTSSTRYFTGTETKLGGVGLDVIATENAARHGYAYPQDAAVRAHERLWTGGEYQWRRDGSPHLFNPDTVFRLQHATRTRRYDIFREYTKLVDDQASELKTLRGLFRLQDRGPRPRADRRGRAGVGDRQAVLDRGDELRLDLARGARDARDRDEQHRRQVEHRRGRRGCRSPSRPRAPQRDQAGRLGALRRDEPLPDPGDRHPDQARAGRQARRGRPAAADEGLPLGRAHASRDGGRRAHLAAAAPRHLLDRRSQAADLRPQARQPDGAGAREAGRASPASARSPRAPRRRWPTSSWSPATTAARARARSTRSSTRARRGSSGSPRRSRRSCSTACATASWCRSTDSSRPAATSSSARCSAPRSSASPPLRSSSRAAS